MYLSILFCINQTFPILTFPILDICHVPELSPSLTFPTQTFSTSGLFPPWTFPTHKTYHPTFFNDLFILFRKTKSTKCIFFLQSSKHFFLSIFMNTKWKPDSKTPTSTPREYVGLGFNPKASSGRWGWCRHVGVRVAKPSPKKKWRGGEGLVFEIWSLKILRIVWFFLVSKNAHCS